MALLGAPHAHDAIRAILFDKDGTLLDFEASWTRVYRELCLELAEGDADKAEAMLVAGGFDPSRGRFRAGGALAAGHTVDIVRLWYPALAEAEHLAMVARIDAVFHANGITCSVPVRGLRDTLQTLAAAGLTLGVATNDGTAAARAALEALGLTGFLPHIYGYDSVAHAKPAPDIVHAFAAASGASPHEIAVVGDNRHDLEMARAAGAGAAIGVLSGNAGREELQPLADAILDSVRDLPAWLEALR